MSIFNITLIYVFSFSMSKNVPYSINVITAALQNKILVNFVLRWYVLRRCYSTGATKKAIHLFNRVSDNPDNSDNYTFNQILSFISSFTPKSHSAAQLRFSPTSGATRTASQSPIAASSISTTIMSGSPGRITATTTRPKS